jgi:hypothetical protein
VHCEHGRPLVWAAVRATLTRVREIVSLVRQILASEIVKRHAVVLAEDDDEVRGGMDFFRRCLAFYGSAAACQAIMKRTRLWRHGREIRGGCAVRGRRRTKNA